MVTFIFLFFFSEARSHYAALVRWKLLCRPGWSPADRSATLYLLGATINGTILHLYMAFYVKKF